MSIFLFSIPGVPVPLFAIAMFLVGAVAFIMIPGKLAGVIALLAATAVGIAVSLAASADLTLLAALLFILLTVCLFFLGINDQSGKDVRRKK